MKTLLNLFELFGLVIVQIFTMLSSILLDCLLGILISTVSNNWWTWTIFVIYIICSILTFVSAFLTGVIKGIDESDSK